jgi:UDP-N-acetylglucosamine--N-acetylmuramyl-(pentapeptide) pyrophosphoryl-undecaprenol N-acetylglucosamine transferase
MAASSSQQTRNIIIAGGGTGGHIYPGIAVARAAERLHPEFKVHFVGAQGGLEEKIVPREGFPLHLVPVGRLHQTVGLATQIKTVLKMPLAFWAAFKILREMKPIVVLGVGGFASGPILLMASLLGYRTLIWEPNAYPGMTNRWLAGRVDECLLVFEEASQYLKARRITRAGLPVRATMIPALRENGKRSLRVFVTGGSQGARFINNLISETVKQNGKWMEGIELVHQVGSLDFQRIKQVYEGAPPAFQVHEYIHDMDRRFAWADLVICRAGASTVAEVCACQKAAIFIPLPTAADDHQRKNAEVLAKADAALMLLQKDLTPEIFRKTLERFRDDRSLIGKFETNVTRFQFPHADEKIVERMLDDSEKARV